MILGGKDTPEQGEGPARANSKRQDFSSSPGLSGFPTPLQLLALGTESLPGHWEFSQRSGSKLSNAKDKISFLFFLFFKGNELNFDHPRPGCGMQALCTGHELLSGRYLQGRQASCGLLSSHFLIKAGSTGTGRQSEKESTLCRAAVQGAGSTLCADIWSCTGCSR